MDWVSVENWRDWAGHYRVLPYVESWTDVEFPRSMIPFWQTPVSALLESGKGGRYSIVVPACETVLTGGPVGACVSKMEDDSFRTEDRISGNCLKVLRDWIGRYAGPKISGVPPFYGGLVGALSYDVVRSFESLPALAEDDLELPWYQFLEVLECYVYDHREGELFISVWSKIEACEAECNGISKVLHEQFAKAGERARELKADWDACCSGVMRGLADCLERSGVSADSCPLPTFSEESFVNAVEKIKNYISEGDTYQVNLSLRESRRLSVTPEEVYEQLRVINPSPYMGLLRFPDFTLVSGSPELLIRLIDGKIESRPIAGTRPRGNPGPADERLGLELIAHPKECAEHLMLVDLIRNDIGRVAEFGSVRVSEYMALERYSHVMHIVSHVEGELAKGKDAFDVLASAFPGGTITGAPKIRTMAIIDEIEPVRRGYYTGAIGWFGFDGNMETNITIRTMVVRNGIAHVQAGAGIVADSVPQKEYEESLNKAKALWLALEKAQAQASLLRNESLL